MKKLIFALCLLIALSAVFCACGENTDDPKDTTETTVAATDTGAPEDTTVTEESTTEAVTYNYDELDTDGNWTPYY
ncbi:MAG: hypothetical protein IJZ80_07595 [Clostridia bacterium]|nr:hypothetical protein [Clostridia bacterium]